MRKHQGRESGSAGVARDGVSRRMSLQRSRDTVPERRLRSELHRLGLRFRVHYRVPEIGRRNIDVALPGPHVAIFVDGCFWHACPVHFQAPRSNREWWEKKLSANVARDSDTTDRLEAAGWRVRRFWEHEDPKEAARAVQRMVEREAASPGAAVASSGFG